MESPQKIFSSSLGSTTAAPISSLGFVSVTASVLEVATSGERKK